MIEKKQRRSLPGPSGAKSKSETVVSRLVVAVLVLISIAVFLSQYQFNPAVKAWSVVRPGLEKESVKPEDAEQEKKMDSILPPPPGFAPLSSPEHFNRETLSEKINGKAELYLPAGFKKLSAQRFKAGDNPEAWFEVFAYDMGKKLNAFSVFSAQRRRGAEPESFAEFAYRTRNALFWVHGPYYVEIIAARVSEKTPEQLLSLARAFNRNTGVAKTRIEELALFPSSGLRPNSRSYIPANAFGFEGFDKVFTATYDQGGQTGLTAFISSRNSNREAVEKARAYNQFLMSLGARNLKSSFKAGEVKLLEFFGAHEIFFVTGKYLAGVHEVPDRDSAEKLARKLYERLKDSGNNLEGRSP